jgi:aminoglycoside phosphotransferase (APT) family kinase protein
MATAPDGIDLATLVPWLEAHVEGLRAPLTFTLVAGGRSNITYRVDDAGGRAYVLRRPPLKQVLATAHDMGREHRIISALGPTDVPVPATYAYCDDPAVNGAPFYVMDFVEGHVVRTRKAAEKVLPEPARLRASESLIEVLGAIHAVDPDAVGLGELGRRDGYIARQLKRWHGQLEHATSAVPEGLHDVHARLSASIPEQGPAAIAHGDFRLDNTLLDDDGRVQAVLDWELCTLGDPLADLGLLLVYWGDPGEDVVEDIVGYPTTAPGFLRRSELVDLYARRTGRDVSQIGYYTAFGYWKLGCILQGVLDRYRDGAMADDGTDSSGFADRVQALAQRAAEALDGAA